MAGTLEDYARKRDFTRTPEPPAKPRGTSTGPADGGRFVVQKHRARRLHYDLRLEIDGVLKSWAVTRGPSLDPSDKRLAVQTEDHPLAYDEFEGTIPEGSYGAGTMMLWDRGTWRFDGDGNPRSALERGKLPLRLDGERLRGAWTLVRMHGKEGKRDTWLLIKSDDGEARPGEGDSLIERADTSCATGRAMDEIAAGATTLPKALPDDLAPQLCGRVETPPNGPQWLHEIKFDGYRLLVVVQDGAARVLTRSGKDWTDRFPTIAAACAALPVARAVIDGEAAVLDDGGVSSFARLQDALGRFGTKGVVDDGDIRLFAFDLLIRDDDDLRPRPLEDRKAALKDLLAGLPEHGTLQYSDHICGGGGADVLHNACGMALEGIISKRRDRPYVAGRGKDWVKSKCLERQDFVIGGFTLPSTKGPGIGALLLGLPGEGGLSYHGKVGTGFTDAAAKALRAALEPLRTKDSPFATLDRKQAGRDAVFVRPELVAEVAFLTWSRDGLVRQASFQGLREDIAAEAVTPERLPGHQAAAPVSASLLPPDLRLTHPDKILFPEAGVSKRGLAEYVALVGDRLLHQVAERPVSLVRCPDGPHKQCFFQRHGFKGLPDGVEDVDLGGKKGRTLVVRSVRGLLGLVQIGVLELHPWGARRDQPDRPDRLIIDLDPDEGLDFAAVKAAALEVRARLGDAGLESFLKVTGGKGLHVVAPLTRRHDWAQVKAFARALAGAMEADSPHLYVASMPKARRKGRLFVDFFRNDRGATAVAAWSPRARAGASVAVPLAWEDMAGLPSADRFTVHTLPRRLVDPGADPWADMDGLRQSLTVRALRSVGLGRR